MTADKSLKPWTYLKRARLRAGFGPRGAAQAIGIGLSHYCSVEAGRYGLSDEKVIRAAEVFGVDVVELEESKPRTPRRIGPSRANDQPSTAVA